MTLDKNIILELRDKHVFENIDLYVADFLFERKKSAKKDIKNQKEEYQL
jgi:hypothetical protein